MKFHLFSKIVFEIPNPISLIECYCYQSGFYFQYDVIRNRKIEDVNKIGARLKLETILKCKNILEDAKNLDILHYSLDELLELDEVIRAKQIKKLNEELFQKLMAIKGINFSTASKILHTIYPEIIPMIDNPLQSKYCKEIDQSWNPKNPYGILVDFYNNLKREDNRNNLDRISIELSKINLKHLSKIRIFDILWWSYLKAEIRKKENGIRWTSIYLFL